VVCAWALLGIAPRPLERAGVVLAAVGAAIVARGAGQGEHRLAGDLAVLAAVVLYGLYLTVARALKDALPPRSYATLVYAGAAVTLALALLFVPAAFTAPAWPLSTHAVVAIVALAVVPTVLGHTAVQSGSRSFAPAVVALVSPGETIGSLAIGAALLRTRPTAVELLGTAVILVGSALALLGARPR
jgi:drug/metabolite transporter (DMT)-like permease